MRSGFLNVERASRPFACILIFPPPLSCQLGGGRTLLEFDLGGGLELFPIRGALARVEIGDGILKDQVPFSTASEWSVPIRSSVTTSGSRLVPACGSEP